MFSYFIARGHSMEPSAKEGDFVFAWKLFYWPRKGDLVVVRDIAQGKFLLKKVREIKGDALWLEGENLADSYDSRQFGWVPKTALVGRAFVIHR
ncbi:MAG: S26 family signal peptidase [bacterium]|nr:S26 family signal peptidase [bacterium]